MEPRSPDPVTGTAPEILVVAGEASGDAHAAGVLRALARRIPGVRFFGMGAEACRSAGLETVADSSEIAVVGITEALRVVPRAREIFAELLTLTQERRPALALLVDSPEFNLRLAKRLKRLGVPVVYYVSPQIWAWRKGRVRQVARDVRRMLVLFPFEVPFYEEHGVDVVHVGHPLVDEVPVRSATLDRPTGTSPRLALLPGSRNSELRALLPPLLGALATLRSDGRELEAVLVQASTIDSAALRELLDEARAQWGEAAAVQVIAEDRHTVLRSCDLALSASGTATLELGLLGVPMIVVYRVSWLTALLARMFLSVPHISLVNLVLGERLVPELVQSAVRPERVAAEVATLLDDPEAIVKQRRGLSRLAGDLGPSGASETAAESIHELLIESATVSSVPLHEGGGEA